MMGPKLIVNLDVEVLGCCQGDVCRSMDLTGGMQDADVQMTLDRQREAKATIEHVLKVLNVVISITNMAQRVSV